MRRRGLACIAIALIASAACGGDGDDGAGDTSEPDPSTTTAAGTPPSLSKYVDIGGGRELALRCRGEGSPMILLEAGDNDSVETWQQVMGAFGEETLTCAYDRAGVGTSDDAVGCRGLDEILGDLDALLAAAELSGPFVLVGHSGGGFLMAGFAERHPEDVSGLVLVETPKALTIAPPGLLDLLKCDHPANVEHRDYYGIEHEVWDDRTQIGEFPVTVISNDWGPDAPPDDTATNVEDQQGWFVLSPNSKQVIVTTGHHVPRDEPDVVIGEVLAVLDAARAS